MKSQFDPISRDTVRVKFEGSLFGPFEIERLTFVAEFKKDELKKVYIHPDDNDEFWESLDQKKYITLAKKFIKEALKESSGRLDLAIKEGYFSY